MKIRSWVLVIAIILVLELLLFVIFLKPYPNTISSKDDGYVESTISAFYAGSRSVVVNSNEKDLSCLLDKIYSSPELFWVDDQYYVLPIGSYNLIVLCEKYDHIDMKQQEIDNVVSAAIDAIVTEHMTEYERALAIHNWICEHVTYQVDCNHNDQDVYGALVLKQASCAGYSEAFAYLLNKAGINAQVVSGEAVQDDGTRTPHSWNVVYIDNAPYYCDITWNDDEGGPTYDWFCVPEQEFMMYHAPNYERA